MQACAEKCQKRMEVLQRSKDSVERKFKELGIPWDTGIYASISMAALSLLAKYMTLVISHVTASAPGAADSSQTAMTLNLLTSAVNFTFKQQQHIGGLNAECTALFDQLSQLVCERADI